MPNGEGEEYVVFVPASYGRKLGYICVSDMIEKCLDYS